MGRNCVSVGLLTSGSIFSRARFTAFWVKRPIGGRLMMKIVLVDVLINLLETAIQLSLEPKSYIASHPVWSET